MTLYFRSSLATALVLVMVCIAAAAPPQANYLFPAGAGRGASVTVTVGGTFDHWPPGVWTDRPEIAMVPGAEKGQLVVTAPADAPPGPCWVRLYDPEGATLPRPFLIGTVPEILETEPNNSPRAPQAVPADGLTVNGRFDASGDVDVFAFDLSAGQTLVASLAAHGSLASPLDGVLQVLSAAGFVLAQNDDDHGLDPQVVYTVPRDGKYLVRAFCFPATPDTTIALAGGPAYVYRLTMTARGFIDHAFPLAVTADQPGYVELVGWYLPENARTWPVPAAVGLPLTDPQTVTLFHKPAANTVQVSLTPHPAVTEAGPTNAEEPQALVLPVTVSGRINPADDADVFRFTGRPAETVAFRLESRSLGYSLDAVLTLTDDAGQVLAKADDGPDGLPDPMLTHTLPAEGPYRLTVADLTRRGDPRFLYRLTAAPPRPDVVLKVSADAFTLLPGTPLEIPVTIERQAGLAAEIELTVEGLPEGVSCPPVTSLPQGDTATAVKLVLTGGGVPFSGPTRILGRAVGGEAPVRAAKAPNVPGAGAWEVLWLTVKAGG